MRKVLVLLLCAAGIVAQEPDWPTGTNPSPAEIAEEMARLSALHAVPLELICAVAHRESGIQQWRADGSFVYNKSDFGLGMMQLTGATAEAYDTERLKTDWRYNLEAGVEVLVAKWNRAMRREHFPPGIEVDRGLLENWYYAVCYYNGKQSDVYVSKIFAHLEELPGRMAAILPAPVTITRPETVLEGFTWGDPFVAVAAGLVDGRGALHEAPVHHGALGDAELYAYLDQQLARAEAQRQRGRIDKALKIFRALGALPGLSEPSQRMLARRLEDLEADGRVRLLEALAHERSGSRRAALRKLKRSHEGLAVGLAAALAYKADDELPAFTRATVHEARGQLDEARALYAELAAGEDDAAEEAGRRLAWLEEE